MRDFTWNYFAASGDVDAYLLYKEMNPNMNDAGPEDSTEREEESQLD